MKYHRRLLISVVFLCQLITGCEGPITLVKAIDQSVQYRIVVNELSGKGISEIAIEERPFNSELDVSLTFDGNNYYLTILRVKVEHSFFVASMIFDTAMDSAVVPGGKVLEYARKSTDMTIYKLRQVVGKTLSFTQAEDGKWLMDDSQIPWDDLLFDSLYDPHKFMTQVIKSSVMSDVVNHVFYYPSETFAPKQSIKIPVGSDIVNHRLNLTEDGNIVALAVESTSDSHRVYANVSIDLEKGYVLGAKMNTFEKHDLDELFSNKIFKRDIDVVLLPN